MSIQVTYEYDEQLCKWDVFVIGAGAPIEALNAFSATVLTAREATPTLECNRAEPLPDGRYKIWVGISDQPRLPDLVDITSPDEVEVMISRLGGRLWINVDGICRLRCCQIKHLYTTAEQGVTGWQV